MPQTYSVGQLQLLRDQRQVLGPFIVPAGDVYFALDIDRTFHARPGVRVDLLIEQSNDGGTTWQERSRETDIGGAPAFDDDGHPVTTFNAEIQLAPQGGSVERQIRVSVMTQFGAFQSMGGSVRTRV